MGIDVGKIRNVAVIAGGGAGKTSLVEAILYDTKAIERMGSIDAENTTTDFEPEELVTELDYSGMSRNFQEIINRINIENRFSGISKKHLLCPF